MASFGVNPVSPEASKSWLLRKTCPSWAGSKSTSHNHCDEVLGALANYLTNSRAHNDRQRNRPYSRHEDNGSNANVVAGVMVSIDSRQSEQGYQATNRVFLDPAHFIRPSVAVH